MIGQLLDYSFAHPQIKEGQKFLKCGDQDAADMKKMDVVEYLKGAEAAQLTLTLDVENYTAASAQPCSHRRPVYLAHILERSLGMRAFGYRRCRLEAAEFPSCLRERHRETATRHPRVTQLLTFALFCRPASIYGAQGKKAKEAARNKWLLSRRYSQFNELKDNLIKSYPAVKSITFPPKVLLGNLQPKVIAQRTTELGSFVTALLEHESKEIREAPELMYAI